MNLENADISLIESGALRELLVRDELARLVLRYANRLDARDPDGVAACFAADAELSFNSGALVHHGIEEIRGVYGVALGDGPRANGESTTHLTANLVIDGLEDTMATGRVKVVAYLLRGSVVRVRGLQFDDEFIRTAHGWRFAVRRHSVDWQSQLPAEEITVPRFGPNARS